MVDIRAQRTEQILQCVAGVEIIIDNENGKPVETLRIAPPVAHLRHRRMAAGFP